MSGFIKSKRVKSNFIKSGFQQHGGKGTLSPVDMQIDQIIKALKEITDETVDPDSFIYDFLLAFNIPKSTITRAKEGGDRNMTNMEGALLLTDKVFFSPVVSDLVGRRTLDEALEGFRVNRAIAKKKPRFYIVTDFIRLLAFDSKDATYSDVAIEDLAGEYMFFLPLAGMTATKIHEEAEADTKAADRMAKLYDQIVTDNPPKNDADRHALNLFLTRLLFCYFAEDTSIFGKRQFTSSVETYTKPDGSDVAEHIGRIFEVLNLAPAKREGLPPHLSEFRYVNGGLFNDVPGRCSPIPNFNTRSRTTLIALGNQSWAEINPDIFGSMFQGVIDEDKRGSLGMHYTSVPNIMKVIEPLFLNDLRDQFQKAKRSATRLNKLLHRIYHLRIFDPACGSGNFLIIAYKELRKLEMDIFHELDRGENLQPGASPFADSQANFEEEGFRSRSEQPPLAIAQANLRLPGIHVSQFYGIEIDDFASEVAVLAMWLAEHQMNVAFQASFGHAPAPLPLKDGAKIVHGNSLREDWARICPTDGGHEVLVLGNPPYYGARKQTADQKIDVSIVAGGLPSSKDLDYIGCFFLKGANYIKGTNSRLAFVSTNSICQGEQVAILWPHIFKDNVEIDFAYSPFKWLNNAKDKAGVTCVIIGLRSTSSTPKYHFHNGIRRLVANLNAYLVEGANIFLPSRRSCISGMPKCDFGNMPNDRGLLLLSKEERDQVTKDYPSSQKFIRRLYGSEEFIDDKQRWCLWIEDSELEEALSFPPFQSRIEQLRAKRSESPRAATRKLASKAHRFGEIRHKEGPSILIPLHTSENRSYIPIGHFSNSPIITNSAIAVYTNELWVFGVIASQMHMVWARAVGGGLETRIRYSSEICYNNFPIPEISEANKKELNKHAEAVLNAREEHPEKTIACLYDPETMPANLLAAHKALDVAVDKCYRPKPFSGDCEDERLAFLFKLYQKMTGGTSDTTDETPEMEFEDA